MKKSAALTALFLMAVCSPSFSATVISMDNQALTQAIVDKTMETVIYGAVGNRLRNEDFTIYFGRQGQIIGHFGNSQGNQPQNDQGTWSVQSDGKLCATWQHWYQSRTNCFYVYEYNNSFVFINADTNDYNNTVYKAFIQSGNQMP